MSYILEALKRAERERRAGTPSLLDDLPNPPPPPVKPAWQSWLLPALISAFVAALLSYLLFGRGTRHADLPPPQAAVPQTPSTPPPQVQTPPQQAINTPATEEAPTPGAIEDDGRIASLDDLEDASASKPMRAAADDGTAEPSMRTAPNTATTHDKRAADVRAGAASLDGADDEASTSPLDEVANKPSAASTHLREMPDAYRADFPPIVVDVHAYAEDQTQRFVLIGGKRYREGDTLPQGPRIASIVPEGIVFDWRGERVLFAMNH